MSIAVRFDHDQELENALILFASKTGMYVDIDAIMQHVRLNGHKACIECGGTMRGHVLYGLLYGARQVHRFASGELT